MTILRQSSGGSWQTLSRGITPSRGKTSRGQHRLRTWIPKRRGRRGFAEARREKFASVSFAQTFATPALKSLEQAPMPLTVRHHGVFISSSHCDAAEREEGRRRGCTKAAGGGGFQVLRSLWSMRSPHDLAACGLAAAPVSVFLRGVGADFQSPQHEIHQPLPVLKVQIAG